MKLFLSSQAISSQQAPHLVQLVGKDAHTITLALIENAADVDTSPKKWLLRNRQLIQSHGFTVERIDIRRYIHDPAALHAKLSEKDVIWLGGGNIYYLRWLLRESGAEDSIKRLVKGGTVYGGGSAGSIVAGPTLLHFETADDQAEALVIIHEGLGLTDTVVLPHMDSPKYGVIMRGIDTALKADGYKTAPLTDAQALIIDGDKEWIV